MKKTTIFYENSFGIIACWTGEIMKLTETHIYLKFSKNKAYKYELKNSGFILVTKKKIKITQQLQDLLDAQISFNEYAHKFLLEKVGEDNIEFHWDGQQIIKEVTV